MHNLLEVIIEKLKKYPEAAFLLTNNSISVKPKNETGFPVMLTVHGVNGYVVYFDFWHEEFNQEEEALNCFALGLSNLCRLKIEAKGNKPFKWTVEFMQEGVWKEESTTGIFNFAFWKKRHVYFLQN